MDLDLQICSRARLARDARFDGKFFIAVITTGIYCRPICRSRNSKESNVRYFASAAAAAEAGFRPCLRCRPECSPGTAAWFGTRNSVSRALRLIEESGLEDIGVESLSERLGIGSRHLRRLFLEHLGATPGAVIQTRRLHFAKKLIDETTLPMTHVAMASGFGCVRRFNAAVRNTYQRTPTQIRKLAKAPEQQSENQYVFRLSYRPPYNWRVLLAYLAARATPGVEFVKDSKYCRTISLNAAPGYVEVGFRPESDELLLKVHFRDSNCLFAIVERVRSMFDLKADWAVIGATLRQDARLRPLIDQNPGMRVPGCWDCFELTTRAILGQQVSVAAATTLAGRIAKEFGRTVNFGESLTRLFPGPEILAEADLGNIGLTKARAATVRALARAVCAGEITFGRFLDPLLPLKRLLEIRGIGRWTTEYVAMRALGEPDAFPSEDLGLMRAMRLDHAADLERRSEPWRPWRAYAAMHLWNLGSRNAKYLTVVHRSTERNRAGGHNDECSSSVVTQES